MAPPDQSTMRSFRGSETPCTPVSMRERLALLMPSWAAASWSERLRSLRSFRTGCNILARLRASKLFVKHQFRWTETTLGFARRNYRSWR